jgi:hypothetical protein
VLDSLRKVNHGNQATPRGLISGRQFEQPLGRDCKRRIARFSTGVSNLPDHPKARCTRVSVADTASIKLKRLGAVKGKIGWSPVVGCYPVRSRNGHRGDRRSPRCPSSRMWARPAHLPLSPGQPCTGSLGCKRRSRSSFQNGLAMQSSSGLRKN